jgi:hypothetical protein
MALKEGKFVRVRGRRWVVQKIDAVPEEDTAVCLACVDDDAAGVLLDVLWERELDAAILGEEGFGGAPVTHIDRPDLFAAYLDTLRWSGVTSTRADLFQSPYRAGIAVKAHQLEPLRKALLLPRANLLIADDVGLGKTIEAGLILREMILRQRVRRVVVACPPSVVLQWQAELERRFGLSFKVLDRAYVLRMRRDRGHAVNPWDTHHKLIISHALLREEAYAGPLRRTLELDRKGSLLILDEAHNAAPSSGAHYAVDSRFTKVVRDLAHRFEHRLFLSATPHNGHSSSFSALLEILDDTRFCRGAPVAAEDRDAVVIRRLKRDIRHALPKEFPERKVVQHVIDGLPADAPDLVLSRQLDSYGKLVEAHLAQLPKAQQSVAGMVVVALQKRLFSSVHAFAHTLGVHRKWVLKHRGTGTATVTATATVSLLPAQLDLLREAPDMDDDRAELPEAEVRAEEDAQLARASVIGSTALSEEEIALLDAMTALADRVKDLPDPRILLLADWIRDNLCPDLAPLSGEKRTAPKQWTDKRLIIFTEYADTKDYLLARLRAILCEPEKARSRIRAFHGGIGDEAREEIKTAFNADPRTEPLRILVCTDAAREGVNLQNHCADLFHFDLPWNPARVEQRNGRIDRTLQRAPVVYCHYFIFAQRPADLVLAAMVKKTGTIHKELGSVGTVINGKLTALLERGITMSRAAELCSEIEQLVEEPSSLDARRVELEAPKSRAIIDAELAELRRLLEQSRVHLDFDADRLRFALDAALGLLGEAPLAAITHESSHGNIPAYRFPIFVKSAAADPTWLPLLDLLRGSREKGELLWDWRRRAPLQPIVLEDSGMLDSGVVHLHLEHPVVRRLLGRFAAQGFVHDDLSRATFVRVSSKVLAEQQVVLFGRLALYGAEAARLHDVLLPVAARIEGNKLVPLDDPEAAAVTVRTALLAYQRLDEKQRLDVLPYASWFDEEIIPRIPSDLAVLRPLLDQRFDKEKSEGVKQLTARGRKESADMKRIITAQSKRIEQHERDANKKYKIGTNQQLLGFTVDEHDQVLSDLAHWKKRLVELGPQAEAEAADIQQHYVVQSVRREASGLVYLWPTSG